VNVITETAFLDELEKIALPGFLGGLAKGWGAAGSSMKRTGMGMGTALKSAPNVWKESGNIANSLGAKEKGLGAFALGARVGGVGRMVAKPAAIAGGGLYAGHKLLGGQQPQQQQRY